MRRALEFADDADWIVLLDDDDPPRFTSALQRLAAFGADMRARDPLTAAVGISGGWFDWRRGRMRRVADDQLHQEAIPLDHVAGNQLPFFLVGAVRRVGVFCEELFFGFSELEFGLRLWTSGSTLYGYGPLWLESRKQTGRVGLELRPSRRLQPVSWRDYYTLRNAIFILRRFGHRRGRHCGSRSCTGWRNPSSTSRCPPGARFDHRAASTCRAIRDGWTDRDGPARRTGRRAAGRQGTRSSHDLSESAV